MNPGLALDAATDDGFVAVMAPLFEGAPRFLARLAAARPFPTADLLFERARTIAHAMPEADQVELIDAHPRLGAAPGTVSPMSFVEQGYDRAAPEASPALEVHAELARLNAAYEDRFGFRYCVFVAGRSLDALLPEMTDALAGDRAAEIHRALDAVVDIARDRASKTTHSDGS